MKHNKGKYSTTNILKRLILYGLQYRFLFITCIIISLLLAWVSIMRPTITEEIIDIDIIKYKSTTLLINSLIVLFGYILAETVLQFFLSYYSNFIAQNVMKNIRTKLYNKLLHFKTKFFDETPNGILVTRSVSDVETISTVYNDGILMVFGDILKIIFVIWTMFAMNWRLALIALAIIPIMIITTMVFQKSLKSVYTQERNATSSLNSFVQERLSGMMIVQLFNQQKREYQKFRILNQDLLTANLKTIFIFSLFFPVIETISAIALGLLIYYGGILALNYHEATAGQIIAFVFFINMLIRPIRQIADRFNNFQQGLVGAERVFKLLDKHDEIPNLGTIHKEKVLGKIEFENVDFSYNIGEPVLKNLSFKVNAGEMVAFVGATGSGKSTITNLISRFYDIQLGKILLDDIEVKDYELHNLRSHIAMVLQEVFLFNDTLYNNIVFGNHAIPLEQVKQAATEIGINDFIEQLPGGYNYIVSERGNSLSSGQKQLISFLRAYLYHPSILVLDEATSSIDTFTEELIQKATDKLTQNRTSIIIAHRLATIQNADRIIVLDKGKIVEQGNHQELLAMEGYYYGLYQAQFESVS